MNIKDTCKKEKCLFWLKDHIDCPFFSKTIWEDPDDGTAIYADDCAPQRNLRLLLGYDTRAMGIQQDFDDMQKTANNLVGSMQKVMTKADKSIKLLEDRNRLLEQAVQIEQKKVGLLQEKLVPLLEHEQNGKDNN